MAINKKGGLKQRPLLPQFPIPPGKNPPPLTKEERDAWAKYRADEDEYIASLFDLDELQKIVTETGAPPLTDTFSTEAILRTVAWGISNKLESKEKNEDSIRREMVKAEIKKCRKEWRSLRKYLDKVESSQRWHINWFSERPWYGREAKEFRENLLSKVQTASAALDDLESYLFITPHQTKGQHGGMMLKNIGAAVDIFLRLSQAWAEAGVNKKVAKVKIYKIVRECLDRMGESVSIDAIKKAIEKHLNQHPYQAENGGGK